jgi:hypothetical protein
LPKKLILARRGSVREGRERVVALQARDRRGVAGVMPASE